MTRKIAAGALALALGVSTLGGLAPVNASPIDTGSSARTTAYLNLRHGPGTGNYVERVIPYHGTVSVLGGPYNGGWYKVSYSGTVGYSWGGYLTQSGGTTTRSYNSNTTATSGRQARTTAALNLRSGPGMGYYVKRVIPYHGTVTVTGGSRNGGWYPVNYNGTTGYVWGYYISKSTGGSSSNTSNTSSSSSNTTWSASTYSSSNSRGDRIASIARQYVGYRYAWGGTSPSTGFDCSGFVYYVYGRAGYSIPRGTTGQANVGHYVSRSNLQPGDILIFQNTYRAGISHAAVYVGNGMMVSSNNPSVGVVLVNMNNSYWSPRYYTARRI